MIERLPLYVANHPVVTGQSFLVTEKFSGAVVAEVSQAGDAELQQAIMAAHHAREAMQAVPSHVRQRVLRQCAAALLAQREKFAGVLCAEVGKPIRDARIEVDRAVDTFSMTADECGRDAGQLIDLGLAARGESYWGGYRRFPVGPVALIAPFNFPLNLAAHKIAPAIAAGCPWILKPASSTPWSSVLLGELLSELELPTGAFSILPCTPATAEPLIVDPHIKKISFTGSPAVGWELKHRCGRKKITLELGGNAACVVEPDVDIASTCRRLVAGLFGQAGQSCISVQRLYVHESIIDRVRSELVAQTQRLHVGDPRQEQTDIGPVIHEHEAQRIETWVQEAVAAGARLLCGGRRQGNLYWPTLLENVPPRLRVHCQEVFGPVGALESYSDFNEVLNRVNASEFGLQAGIFTRDLHRAYRAWEKLEVGGVVINDIPSWRGDNMPYGGVKASGVGREGPRFAIDEMTEIRSFVVRRSDS